MRELMGSLIRSRRGCSLFLTNPLQALSYKIAPFSLSIWLLYPAVGPVQPILRQVYLLKRCSDLLINLRRGTDDVIVLWPVQPHQDTSLIFPLKIVPLSTIAFLQIT